MPKPEDKITDLYNYKYIDTRALYYTGGLA